MKTRFYFILGLLACASEVAYSQTNKGEKIISPLRVREYVERFNSVDDELYVQLIPNVEAADFLMENIPRMECPDAELEEIYYFRWWTYRKHIRKTPEGFIITEFLPPVPWAGKYNGICCPAMHHFNEGRWLRHAENYLDAYALYWLKGGGSPRRYSFPVAHALYQYFLATGRDSLLRELLPDLIANFKAWEEERRDSNGLFWQTDNFDGMEVSAASALLHTDAHYRATINSYMFAEAHAISLIAELAGQPETSGHFRQEAERIRLLLHSGLWDSEAEFYKVAPRVDNPATPLILVNVREQHGYTPWYVEALNPPQAYSVAWKQLLDSEGFAAPFGPTTTEKRHPEFQISYEGHECQWNGPSWPLATSITLTGLANLLNNREQNHITKKDYFELLKIYAHSHHLTREDGTVVNWIDENLNPFTGDWISRTRLKTWNNGTWADYKGGIERGKDYNHSTFCDLVITGLAGIRPQANNELTINPLLPSDTWDYFCVEDVSYKGHMLTILYDKYGTKYRCGKGLMLFIDGKLKTRSDTVRKIAVRL